jgi:geranylgeranyl diphosphate synthase type I
LPYERKPNARSSFVVYPRAQSVNEPAVDALGFQKTSNSAECSSHIAIRKEILASKTPDQEPFTVEAILATRAAPAARLAALGEYVRMTRSTAYGQLLDIRSGVLDPGTVREEDVLAVHRFKSAIYTVASPLKIGALLGGSTLARLGDIETFGTNIGIAFQLRDDVLGAGFDAEESGKSPNDLIEGKRTLLVVKAWANGSEADRSRLARVLGNSQATPEDVERARNVIRETGSLDYSEKRIDELTRAAVRCVDRSRTIPARGKPLLKEVAERLVRRKA